MITTIKTRAESLLSIGSIRTASPLKSSFSTVPPDSPDILSAAVLHKRRPQKHVRFALKLEPVEEDSLPPTPDISASLVSKSNTRIVDPWRQNRSLYGAYVEYLEKQDTLTPNEFQIHRSSPPAPEPGAQPPTYTHTFVIQSKSPELVIDSITVSTPLRHLPRILYPTKTANKQRLPTIDSYVKQQLTLSTSPRLIQTKKVRNSSIQKNYYASVHAAVKRAELNIPSTNGLQTNNKIIRTDNLVGSKFVNDNIQSKRLTEIITKPLPGINNQINHFSERSILPNYSKKPRMHNRTHHSNDEFNPTAPYFYQNHDNDNLIQPIIHSTR